MDNGFGMLIILPNVQTWIMVWDDDHSSKSPNMDNGFGMMIILPKVQTWIMLLG